MPRRRYEWSAAMAVCVISNARIIVCSVGRIVERIQKDEARVQRRRFMPREQAVPGT